MRYFFVSDLHGCDPTILQVALVEQGFVAAEDTLVVLGDICDRGPHTYELIDYVTRQPHFIAVRGNHDIRTAELIRTGQYPAAWDKTNGVGATFGSLLGWPAERCNRHHTWLAMQELYHAKVHNAEVAARVTKFLQYVEDSVWGIEFDQLIAVHAWLPCNNENNPTCLREHPALTSDLAWSNTVWSNTEQRILRQLYPTKHLLVGHWHTWRLHRLNMPALMRNSEAIPFNFETYEDNHITAIDAATNYSNQVNVYIYQSSADPLVYLNGHAQLLSEWRKAHE